MSLSKDLSVKLYQSIAEENEERVYKLWHASSISICPRAHYFHRLGVAGLTKPSGAKVIRWGAGHKLEEQLRPHIDKVWGETSANVRLTSDKWSLTGEYDNLSKDGKTLIEVKSVSDWAFYKGPLTSETTLKQDSGEKNKWNRPVYEPMPEPYIHHVLQNHAYALLLGETVENIDFVYASLSGLLCVYQTKVEPKYIEWVKRRLTLLNEAWEAQEPPECLCDESSPLWGPVFQWCDYRTDAGCCSLDLAKDKHGKSI
jgi:hypothetical protein